MIPDAIIAQMIRMDESELFTDEQIIQICKKYLYWVALLEK